jgi:hypothetical protein
MMMTTEQSPEHGPNGPEIRPPQITAPGPIAPWVEPPDAPDDQRDEEQGYGHGV